MKQTFDWGRFFRMFFNDFVLNGKRYALIAVAVLALTLLLFAIYAIAGQDIELDVIVACSFFVFMAIQLTYSTMIWSEFTSRRKTISLLTLPVNRTEVFFQKMISSLVIFPLIYILYTLLVLQIAVEYNHLYYTIRELETKFHDTSVFWFLHDLIVNHMEECSIFFCFWLFAATACFWGGVMFKKFALLKNIAFWFVFCIAFWFVTIIIRLFMTGAYHPEIVPLLLYSSSDYTGDLATLDFIPWIHVYLTAFIGIFLLLISYFRYKEKTL